MNEMTDKTYVLVTRNLGKVWITKDQAARVAEVIDSDLKYIRIGEDLIMISNIAGIRGGEAIKELEKVKRGDWKCKFDMWHSRGQECGHDGRHW